MVEGLRSVLTVGRSAVTGLRFVLADGRVTLVVGRVAGRAVVEDLRSELADGRSAVTGLRFVLVDGRVTLVVGRVAGRAEDEGLRSALVDGRVAEVDLPWDVERFTCVEGRLTCAEGLTADDLFDDDEERLTELPDDLCTVVRVVLEERLDERVVPVDLDSLWV